jgi:RNA polymerase sigma-70 factor, ECF subfamily
VAAGACAERDLITGAPHTDPVIGDGFGALLDAARQGDETAFGALWRDANPGLVRYLRLVAGDAAEDLAADTWLSAVRGLRRFHGDEASWRSWLFTIARRRAVDASRRRWRQPLTTELTDDQREAGEALAPDSADEAIQAFDTRAALALVAELPPLQGEVIMLRVVAGLAVEDVARMLGRSPGAVRVAAHRGLRTLERILAERGVTR